MIKKFIKPVYAHCDIPCGIYETDTMRHAADTCLRMIEIINDLGGHDHDHNHGHGIEKEISDNHNNFVRCVVNKEKYAQAVKQQIYILWSDYFKPEHLEKFPDLHTTLWQATKQASKVKQSISREEAEKLVSMVADIGVMFAESKK